MNKRLVLLGGGGHGKVCYEIANLMRCWEEIVILDDNLTSQFFNVAGKIEDWIIYKEESDFFVAIGDNTIRKKIYEKLYNANVSIVTLIHPSAIVSTSSVVLPGTVLMPYSVVNTASIIGHSVIINTGAIVEHDCKIANYVHISPNATVSGGVSIEELTWIGTGAMIKQTIQICSNTIVGMGAVVVNHIRQRGVYIGVPATKYDAEEVQGENI